MKQVLEPGVPYDSAIYQEWCNLVEDKGIEIVSDFPYQTGCVSFFYGKIPQRAP